jgi:hypothetical protein
MTRIASGGGRLVRPPHFLRIRPRALILLCGMGLTLAVGGIAAGQTGGIPGQKAQRVQARSPACAHAGNPVGRPAAIPAKLLPPGTVLTSSRPLGRNGTLVAGVIPREFRSAIEFYLTRLPRAGYRNLAGDAEMDEAEAFFAGRGLRGKWKVNGILSCSRAVTLALYVRKT